MNHVVITAVGGDRTGIVKELSDEVLKDGGNIEDSRMAKLGGSFAIIMLVAGEKKTIETLLTQVPRIEQDLGLTIVIKQTEPSKRATYLIPYRVDIVSMDHPGIVHRVADYFARKEINIEEMSTATYAAAHTGTPIFSMHITIEIDAESSIAELRNDFQEFCDDLNLDASMEPATTAVV